MHRTVGRRRASTRARLPLTFPSCSLLIRFSHPAWPIMPLRSPTASRCLPVSFDRAFLPPAPGMRDSKQHMRTAPSLPAPASASASMQAPENATAPPVAVRVPRSVIVPEAGGAGDGRRGVGVGEQSDSRAGTFHAIPPSRFPPIDDSLVAWPGVLGLLARRDAGDAERLLSGRRVRACLPL